MLVHYVRTRQAIFQQSQSEITRFLISESLVRSETSLLAGSINVIVHTSGLANTNLIFMTSKRNDYLVIKQINNLSSSRSHELPKQPFGSRLIMIYVSLDVPDSIFVCSDLNQYYTLLFFFLKNNILILRVQSNWNLVIG